MYFYENYSELKDQIKYLRNTYNVRFKYKEELMKWDTGQIKIKGYNLGRFEISFSVNSDDMFWPKATSKNLWKNKKLPHQGSFDDDDYNYLCLGNSAAFRNALMNFEIINVYDMANNVIKNINLNDALEMTFTDDNLYKIGDFSEDDLLKTLSDWKICYDCDMPIFPDGKCFCPDNLTEFRSEYYDEEDEW